MNSEQRGLRTKWGMLSADHNSFELAYNSIPRKYKRWRRMLKHQMDKLEKKMRDIEKQFSMYGD